MLRFATILLFALAATWWVLSGYTKPLLLSLGAISLALVLVICARMRILDRETAPYMTVPQTLAYFGWLFVEIIKANIAVVRQIVSPDMEVSPTLTRIPARGKTDLAKTMFANSITLTPGTVSLDVADDHIVVHALLEEMSAPEDFAEMSDRSAWAVGEPDDPHVREGL
ncbi:Na+/H+ antiporter subunit E [uncultured Algimonas sp.]|uniref:Na+/H+ antiporter subunit E n=1 Tax=uncultured Algimonas sp. TaxID=1547920 RepID=UPI0026073551|nr:Na+/H+ antiporter subunit E [uncultured Algimonas sp.]